LEAIRALGVLVALDDFGTGWSSMSWLRELPVDALKIPKEFLGGLGASEKDWEFARAIVTLGHSLRLGVIAEGIEYADQVDRLREIGVESGQGFFFSPPVEAASIPTLLNAEGKSLASGRTARRPGRQTQSTIFPVASFQLQPLGADRQH
jgi:EAL domain-containing protein (putative c-di-GMP-specific phosphodiesterase class I)